MHVFHHIMFLLIAAVSLGAQAPQPSPQLPKGQMPDLGRHTNHNDAIPLFDFDAYFVGRWTFEWDMPEGPLAPAGRVEGSTVYRTVGPGAYEARTEAQGPDGKIAVKESIRYAKEQKTLTREVTDSRGFAYTQTGTVGGDLGGIYTIFLESTPFTVKGRSVRLKQVMRLTSPLNYRVSTTVSDGDAAFRNYGSPWFRKEAWRKEASSSNAGVQEDGGYRLVPNWPTLPPGSYFGLKDAPPPPAEREAQAAARRARGQTAGGGGGSQQSQPGISGLAIDQRDRIYVFNRGPKPVMVFDRDGRLVTSGADQEINGKTINPSWQHSGGVDWEGNVYVIERDAHRIVKLSPGLDKFLLQLGTTNERGTDATHLDLPSGIAILRNGNIVVTDGYGNNRVAMFSKDGKFIKQVAKGAGGPQDKGTGDGEWVLPHKLATDAEENLYIIDRENHRIQVFDKNLNYVRQFANDGWYPWDIGISRRGTDGFGFIADHAGERIHKIALKDGKILATWGKQGLAPGEFDWVHGVVVDSRGAVYAADTYGQRLQKFAPVATSSSR